MRDLQSTANKGTRSSSRTRWKVEETFLEETELPRSPWEDARHGPVYQRKCKPEPEDVAVRFSGQLQINVKMQTQGNKTPKTNWSTKQLMENPAVNFAKQAASDSQVCTSKKTWPPPLSAYWTQSENMTIKKWKLKDCPGSVPQSMSGYLSFHLFLSWDTHARLFY